MLHAGDVFPHRGMVPSQRLRRPSAAEDDAGQQKTMPSLQEFPTAQPPFLSPIWAIARIERFDPIGVKQARQDDPGAVTTDHVDEAAAAEACGRLRAEGLAVGAAGRAHLPIVGGTSVIAGSSIVAYEEGFMISRGKDGSFHAQVAGRPGHRVERHSRASLGEAVDLVLTIYRRRGSLTVPR